MARELLSDSKPMSSTGTKTGTYSDSRGSAGTRRSARLAAGAFCLAVAICVAPPLRAEDAPQAPPAAQPEKPGMFESIARWFERGFAGIKSGFGDAKSNLDSLGEKAAGAGKSIGDKAAEAGKSAADAVKNISSMRMVDGHAQCDISANGAPDCRAAATSMCMAKGYTGGQSIDFVSAEKCPPAVWMKRRKPEPGECVTETFVTRAMCR